MVLPSAEGVASVQEAAKMESSSDQTAGAPNPILAAPSDQSIDESPTSSPQKQKNRCDTCRKRVGLTGK